MHASSGDDSPAFLPSHQDRTRFRLVSLRQLPNMPQLSTQPIQADSYPRVHEPRVVPTTKGLAGRTWWAAGHAGPPVCSRMTAVLADCTQDGPT